MPQSAPAPRKVTRRKRQPVDTSQVSPVLLAAALERAGGDRSKIVIVSLSRIDVIVP
jgi:hypothetical protein